MTYQLLSAELVNLIHDDVLNAGELAGRARDKSLEGALARVDNRLAYGMIDDAYDLAAAYCVAVATGHCFNDGNKRTAFRTMHAALALNSIDNDWPVDEIGPLIIRVAQSQVDETELSIWLRKVAP